MANKNTVIHWFRKGLRLHDNPALLEAVEEATKNKFYLRPIFILDPNILKWLKVGANRWRFLQESLSDLNDNLKKIGSCLYVVRGEPKEVFVRIFKEWKVKYLSFELDIEPYAKQRDKQIENIAKSFDVTVVQRVSHTLYDTEQVVRKNLGKPPLTYQRFLSVAESLGKISAPISLPKAVATFSIPLADNLESKNPMCYDPPTLQELGVKDEELGENKFPGGETEALKRLEKYMKMKNWVCKFEKPNTSPNSIEPSTTVLSPYLKFGCLSCRTFYQKLKETIGNSPHSKPPVSLIGQLMWREFYYCVGDSTPNYDKMVGNPICYQIPWTENEEYFLAWKLGKTGYPFIDAIMRQLRLEGWIHHLARHAVACFLTRGDLWISWERGQEVFEEYLLDADWALNAGNWMWLSASAFFHQYFRVYSPVAFGKKTDKSGAYIRKYVPELGKYPDEYIYEPWSAPKSVQTKAGCIVGKDYPNRVVIHESVHKENIKKMAEAYKKNKESKLSEGDQESSKTKKLGKRKSTAVDPKQSISKYVKKM